MQEINKQFPDFYTFYWDSGHGGLVSHKQQQPFKTATYYYSYRVKLLFSKTTKYPSRNIMEEVSKNEVSYRHVKYI